MRLKLGLFVIFATILMVAILMIVAILTSITGLKEIDILIHIKTAFKTSGGYKTYKRR